MNRYLGWLLVAGLLGWISPASAQEAISPEVISSSLMPALSSATTDGNSAAVINDDPFAVGTWTFQAMAGYFKRTSIGPGGPGFDYAPIGVRVGYIIDSYLGDSWLRGYTEILIEGNYSKIIRTFGSNILGPNAILRYNFVQPDAFFVPYIQAGAGLAFNDAWHTPPNFQGLIGERMEFLLRAELGTRMMLTDNFSFDIEAGFQHISNAGLARHNGGVNMLGASVGFTYYFGNGR